MFPEILLFLLIGVILGVIAGLVPGLHPNTIAFLLLSVSPLLGIGVMNLIAILVSSEITNSFMDFIPSILFSAPEEATALSILPGQRFLLSGRAYEAIYLTVYGGLISIIVIALLFPIFIILIPIIYSFVKPTIVLLLLLTIIYLFHSQKRNRFPSLLVFVFSALLGLLIFKLPFSGSEVLFPAFCGLFGLSSLFDASSKTEIPEQEIDVNLEDCSGKKSSIVGVFSGMVAGLLPGVGSSQVTVMSQQLFKINNLKDFMISIGGITTAGSLFSIVALWTIGNPRSGTSVAIQSLSFEYTLNALFIILFMIVISAGIASLLTLLFSKILIRNIYKIKYNVLTKSIFGLLFVFVGVFTGWIGIVITITGLAIGIYCIKTGVRRSFMMGVLLVPTVLVLAGV
ncbi:MAG: tripartite tricarboxylate transporter permease [Candidatus Aenigmarchaeota archaeon]|nr:tripartite tricarboxylate transporter permease [Candidatus Aenigmarchaeota archaeon]